MISTAAMTKAAMLASAVSLTVSPIAIQAAFAQDQGYGPPPQGQGYDQGQAPDQGNNGPPDQYYDQPP
ncbi:MAG TPA: hypothetical protein VME40_17405, partial [Caulobacteraceae bacterium]|nr:hypothetical protein [Caulobacteraceae bacterium]